MFGRPGIYRRPTETLTSLALCEAKLGNKNDAVRTIRRATQSDPDNPEYIYFEALVLHLAGNRASALDSLRKAVAKGYPVSEILAEPEWHDLSDNREFKGIVGGLAKKEN